MRLTDDEKPLIAFGQDECIFKQYTFTKKAWVGPNGEKMLIPKDDGQGILISAFQSCEFAFGLTLTKEQLDEINKKHNGEKYCDKKAAIHLCGTDKKPVLTKSPLVCEFENGANNDGKWNYETMVEQLEDSINGVDYLCPQYDFMFLFNHSSSHDQQQEDGLIIEYMAKSYGGKQ